MVDALQRVVRRSGRVLVVVLATAAGASLVVRGVVRLVLALADG